MTDRTEDDTSEAAAALAQETMKLVESLGAWAGSTSSSHAFDAGHADAESDEDAKATQTSDATCSCSSAHVPAVCRVCPVCRVGAFLEGLSPEAMERIADLIGMVAGSLQTVAQERRSGKTRTADPGESERPATSRKVPVSADAPPQQRDTDADHSAE